MFFNKSVEIDLNNLPSILRKEYYKLLNFFNKNEEDLFSIHEEVFEASIKQNYIDGKISKQQQEKLFNVIGLY